MSFRPPRLRLPGRHRSWLAVAVALGVLATVPTEGADGHLERPKLRVAMASAEAWSLRPTEVAVPLPPGGLRRPAATAIPEARRSVRLVYPALVAAR